MKLTCTILVLFLSLSVIAQDPSVKDFEAPKKLPKSEKDFKNSESNFIKAALWLETTQMDTTSTKRTLINAWTLAWVSDCPYVTVEINEPFLNLVDNNGDLMFVGISNYVKYCLQNNSNDKIKAFTAGIKAVINCYNLGGQLKQDNELDEAIKADKDGKLEEWVRNKMKS